LSKKKFKKNLTIKKLFVYLHIFINNKKNFITMIVNINNMINSINWRHNNSRSGNQVMLSSDINTI